MTLESLMRTVAPSGGDFAVRSAATVLPAPGRFSTTNCWPSAAVHFAASMRASVSGLPPGASPTRTRTGFCGHACAPAAPDHTAATSPNNSTRRFIRPPLSELRVNAQQVGNRLRRPPAEAALGGDAEIASVSRGSVDAFSRSFDTVRVMHEPEEEFRLRTELEA